MYTPTRENVALIRTLPLKGKNNQILLNKINYLFLVTTELYKKSSFIKLEGSKIHPTLRYVGN